MYLFKNTPIRPFLVSLPISVTSTRPLPRQEIISPSFTIRDGDFTSCQLSFSLSDSMSLAILLREVLKPAAAIESNRKEATVARISLTRYSRGSISARTKGSIVTAADPAWVILSRI